MITDKKGCIKKRWLKNKGMAQSLQFRKTVRLPDDSCPRKQHYQQTGFKKYNIKIF